MATVQQGEISTREAVVPISDHFKSSGPPAPAARIIRDCLMVRPCASEKLNVTSQGAGVTEP